MDDTNSLTGVWDGVFSYPRRYKPTTFTAVLFESGAALSGTVHELSNNGSRSGQRLEASIDGRRAGSEVYFEKVYPEGMSDHGRPIDYAGRVNADATEIEGTWTVRGSWSGKFLMVRSGRQQQAETRRARRSVPVS